MLRHLPDGQALVGRRIPVLVELVSTQQAHLAALGLEDAGLRPCRATEVFLALESVSASPNSPRLNAELLEPGNRPARVRVELALCSARISSSA